MSPAECAVWDRVRRFVDDEVLPVAGDLVVGPAITGVGSFARRRAG